MSNRFYRKIFLRCKFCGITRREAEGYKPIANPILFDAATHCRNYHLETQRSYPTSQGVLRSTLCAQCHRIHSHWDVLDHQRYIDTLSLPRNGSKVEEEKRKIIGIEWK